MTEKNAQKVENVWIDEMIRANTSKNDTVSKKDTLTITRNRYIWLF